VGRVVGVLDHVREGRSEEEGEAVQTGEDLGRKISPLIFFIFFHKLKCQLPLMF
jgi:hypothetical protein